MNNSIEVFKLAQEKGYKLFFHPDQLEYYVDEQGNPYVRQILIELTLIQKWLREKHHIIIGVKPTIYVGEKKVAYWYPETSNSVINLKHKFKTFEEALSVGIEHGLKQLP